MKPVLIAATIAALLVAYVWAVNEIHTDMQGWDEVDFR